MKYQDFLKEKQSHVKPVERRRINVSDDLFGNVAGADAGKDE